MPHPILPNTCRTCSPAAAPVWVRFGLSLILALLFGATAASAQDAERPKDDVVQLSPFIVQSGEQTYVVSNSMTGTRINTKLVDLPFAAAVLTSQFLDDTGTRNLTEALRYVSSVRSLNNNAENFTIRGFNSGAPLRNYFATLNANRSRTDTADIDRVEVLKGTVSMLYGIGNPGGIVNIVTKKPLSVHRDSLTLEAASWNNERAVLDSTGPIKKFHNNSELLYRVIAAAQNTDSFRDFEEFGRRFINGQLEYRSDRLTLRGEVRVLRQRENEAFSLTPFNAALGVFSHVPRSYNSQGPDTWANYDEYNGFSELIFKLDDHWSVRNGSSYNQAAFHAQRRVGEGLIAPALTAVALVGRQFRDKTQSFVTQTDLTGTYDIPIGKLTMVAGYLWETNSQVLRRFDNTKLPQPNFPVYDTAAQNFSIGDPLDYKLAQYDDSNGSDSRLYGLAQLSLFHDRLLLMGGAGRIAAKGDLINRVPASPVTTHSDISKTVPQGGVSFRIANDVNVYASYGQSFVPNSRFPTTPETGYSYEAGVKAGRPNLNGTLAFFDSRRENIAISVFDTATNTPTFSVGGKVQSRGIEADFYYQPANGLEFMTSYALLDTKVLVSDDEIARPDRKGTSLPNAPHNQIKVWMKKTLAGEHWGFKKIWFGLGSMYTSSMRPDADPSRFRLITPGFARFDLALGARLDLSDKVRLQTRLGVENLLDKDYLDQGTKRGTPRAFRATFTFEF